MYVRVNRLHNNKYVTIVHFYVRACNMFIAINTSLSFTSMYARAKMSITVGP